MPCTKTPANGVSGTTEVLSRHGLLEWVNNTTNGEYKKIEELCSGVAYCQMMEILFPGCVGQKRIKSIPKLEHEYLHNLKLLQLAFNKLNLDKSVPIDRLLRGKFQDNLEFLQWFKKFYDTQILEKANLNTIKLVDASLQGKANISPDNTVTAPKNATRGSSTTSPSSEIPPSQNNAISPATLRNIQQRNELQNQVDAITFERNFYQSKFAEVQLLLNVSIKNNQHVEWATRALKILHSANDAASITSEASSI